MGKLRAGSISCGEMFRYVEEQLNNGDIYGTSISRFPFRKRSDHIRRVLMWAERLSEGYPDVNREALFTATVFHDVGYAKLLDGQKHAEISAIICEHYLTENDFDSEMIEMVTYLVRNHSHKQLMADPHTPLELILLMEADLMDESGALSIVWDCMMEGAQAIQSFEKTYEHIRKYSGRLLAENPMVTPKAKVIWESKQKLVREFINHLEYDLDTEQNAARM
jgi:uncharacterized protein